MEELVGIAAEILELEEKNNRELIRNLIIRANAPEEPKKQYENSKEGELLQELDETRDTYRRRELIEEIKAIRLEPINKKLLDYVERLNSNIEENNNTMSRIRSEIEKMQKELEDKRKQYDFGEFDAYGQQQFSIADLVAEINELSSKIETLKMELNNLEKETSNLENLLLDINNKNWQKILDENKEFQKKEKTPENDEKKSTVNAIESDDGNVTNNKDTQSKDGEESPPVDSIKSEKDDKKNVSEDSTKEKENPYINLSDKELKEKLEELWNDYDEERQFRTHAESGLEEHADNYLNDLLNKIDKIKAEQARRKENPYINLSDKELEEKLAELENDYMEEYQFRDHQQSGTEENEDDYLNDLQNKIDKIKEEQARRKVINLANPEEPIKPGMIGEKTVVDPPVKPPKSNLPIRSFWEIYNSTCTEHAGSIATFFHSLANMKVLPPKQEDAATKVLSILLVPLKGLTKLLALMPNAIFRTNKKMKELQENIDSLSREEFEALINNPEEIKERFPEEEIKSEYDKDFLNSQFKKQYKVNDLYLRAVENRLNEHTYEEINAINATIKKIQTTIDELDKKSVTEGLTAEEKETYINAVTQKLRFQEVGKKIVEKKATFEDGTKKKSFGYKNIKGWFLGVFNPDNRAENAKIAELAQKRREAYERGDTFYANKLTENIEQYTKEQTNIKGKVIDIGKYSIEAPVEVLNNGPDNRFRLLGANAAILISILNYAKQLDLIINNTEIMNANNAKMAELQNDIDDSQAQLDAVQAQIDDYGADVEAYNQAVAEATKTLNEHKKSLEDFQADLIATNYANSNIIVSGVAKMSEEELAELNDTLSRIVLQDVFNARERSNLDVAEWMLNSIIYKTKDAALHAGSKAAYDAIQLAKQTGDYDTVWDILMKFKDDFPIDVNGTLKYANNNPQFDYSAVNLSSDIDYEIIRDYIDKIDTGIPYEDAVQGVMATMPPEMANVALSLMEKLNVTLPNLTNMMPTLDGINQSENLLPLIMATANAMRQGRKQGIRDSLQAPRTRTAKRTNKDEKHNTKPEDGRGEK